MSLTRHSWVPPLLAATFVVGTVTAITSGTYWYWSHHRAEQLETECDVAMKARDWPRLEQLAREWLYLDSDNSVALLYLGEAAQRQDDFETTAECLASIRDDDPRCVQALIELVELQLAKLNRPLDAAETCQRILRISPSERVAHQRLVFFYGMSLQYRKMEEQIQAALKADCVTADMLIYHFGGSSMRFSNGVDITSHWLEAHPDSELFEVARAIHLSKTDSTGELSETESNRHPAVDACLEKYPQNLQLLASQLDQFIADGDLDGIVRVLGAAPGDAEHDARFWRARGWLLQAQAEFESARDAYERALELSPYDWRARHQYAGVLRRLGTTDGVEDIADLAVEGKQLERQLFELPSTAELPTELRFRLTEHARQVGDVDFASLVESHFRGGTPSG